MPVARLLSAGEAFEDLVFLGLDRLPGPGEEIRTTRFAQTIGGGAVITAVAAARLGARVDLISGLSDSAARRLRRERISVTNLRRRGEPHAISVALSTPDERTFVTFEGVNAWLEPRLACAVASTRATHVHLALDPRDCSRWVRRVARLRRRGVTTSADFGWNARLAGDRTLPVLLDALDIVFVNEREAALYAGRPSLDDDALAFWRERRSVVVIKLGALGCRLLAGGRQLSAAAPRVRAVDTTGAGDAFNGGFLYAWLRGRSLGACLASGNRLGAASTRKAGGLDALPEAVRR